MGAAVVEVAGVLGASRKHTGAALGAGAFWRETTSARGGDGVTFRQHRAELFALNKPPTRDSDWAVVMYTNINDNRESTELGSGGNTDEGWSNDSCVTLGRATIRSDIVKNASQKLVRYADYERHHS